MNTEINGPSFDRFQIGWRDVFHRLPDGTGRNERIPLTLEDALHPQLGDCLPESTSHSQFRDYLASVFRWRVKDDPSAYVLSRCGIFWTHPSVRHFAPDIAVFSGVEQPQRILLDEVYLESKYKKRPWLIVEIVMPHMRDNDIVIKFRDYHQLKIETFVIVDQETLDRPWSIVGFQYRADGYARIVGDDRGRIKLERLGNWLGIENERVACYDCNTEERIGDYTEVSRRLKELRESNAERDKLRATEARIKEIEAELARLRGE